MATNQFHHFGVPTNQKSENEQYIEGGKVYITDATQHPFNIEFLRFEEDSPMPEKIKTQCHAAFLVDSIEDAMKGHNVLLEPFDATEKLRVAFITDGNAVIEIMESKE